MVDTVSSYKIVDGPKNLVMVLNNVSDATGEALVKKVDVTTLFGYDARTPLGLLTNLRIRKIKFSTLGPMAIRIFWEGTPNVLAWSIPAAYMDELDFRDIGGLQNTATAKTGNILLSTIGATATSGYNLILDIAKN